MNRKSVLCAIAIASLAMNRLLLQSAVAATLAGHQVQGGATLRLSISDQQLLPGNPQRRAAIRDQPPVAHF